LQREAHLISSQHLWSFLIASMAIILAPGPSVLFAIARAIAWGRVAASITVAGNAFGMLVLAVFVAVGLGPLLDRSELLFYSLQIAGGLYLVWMGFDAIRHRVANASEMTAVVEAVPAPLKNFWEGFIVGILNPKAIVFFAAIFPQFVDRNLGNVTLQLISLGAVFSMLALLSDGTWAIAAGTARKWLSGDARRLVTLRYTGGLVMVVLGIAIVIPVLLSFGA
jgi:threonine/homoserine/homoserine lactone efflux protein